MGNQPKPPGRRPIQLDAAQRRKLARVAVKGNELFDAKMDVIAATENLRQAALEALGAGVPLQRVADAAGVHRPVIYEWKADR